MADIHDPQTTDTAALDAAEGLDVETKRPFRLALGRFWRNRGAAISTVIFLTVVLAVIFTNFTARYGIDEQEWRSIIETAFEGERGQNFIGSREELMAAAGLEGGRKAVA